MPFLMASTVGAFHLYSPASRLRFWFASISVSPPIDIRKFSTAILRTLERPLSIVISASVSALISSPIDSDYASLRLPWATLPRYIRGRRLPTGRSPALSGVQRQQALHPRACDRSE